jgi:hypothetical protein
MMLVGVLRVGVVEVEKQVLLDLKDQQEQLERLVLLDLKDLLELLE